MIILGELLLWFYRLSIREAIVLLLICSIVFCGMERLLKHRRWWRWLCIGLLAALAAAVLYVTVGSRSGSAFQVNLIPFHSYRAVLAGGNPELYRSNFMNAALFYPAGLLLTSLLPQKWRTWCRCLLAVTVLLCMSVGIEYVQYHYVLGQVEIDDVIHNTAGALAGSLAAVLMPPVLKRVHIWIKKTLCDSNENPTVS